MARRFLLHASRRRVSLNRSLKTPFCREMKKSLNLRYPELSFRADSSKSFATDRFTRDPVTCSAQGLKFRLSVGHLGGDRFPNEEEVVETGDFAGVNIEALRRN